MPDASKGNSTPHSRASFGRTARLLRSLFASGELERELRESLLTAEAVVGRVLQRWYQKIAAIENPTLRQRADDVLDLGRNVIRRLRGEQGAGFQAVPEGSILVAQHLLPSDVVLIPRSRVAAVVVEALGQGSHAALLAREKGIPTVAGFPGILSRIGSRTELLVDGFRGTLVVAPRGHADRIPGAHRQMAGGTRALPGGLSSAGAHAGRATDRRRGECRHRR